MAIAQNPYRTPADSNPPEPPTPPPPYPGPEKWKNPLWLGFFGAALSGSASNMRQHLPGELGRPSAVWEAERVNDTAEEIANEAWRRATRAGHPDAFVVLPPRVAFPP